MGETETVLDPTGGAARHGAASPEIDARPHPGPLPRGEGSGADRTAASAEMEDARPHPGPLPRGEGSRLKAGLPAGSLKWTRHPVADVLIPPLKEAEVKAWLGKKGGFDATLAYWTAHEQLIREAEMDPLHNGFEFEFWKDVREFMARKDELYALGGNSPGKTEIGGKLAVETLMRQRGMKVLCVAQNDNASKQLQQPAVYKYLPPGLRQVNERSGPKKRDTIKNITWSQKGGFTEGTFVMPNRSQCWFKTVEQYERDNTSFEGPEYDLVWIDEPAPLALLITLRYRVGKRRGKVLFTFTAVKGFDAVCADVLTGARMLKTLPMDWQWQVRSKNPNFKLQTSEKVQDSNFNVPASEMLMERGARDKRIVIPELDPAEVQVKGCPAGHMPFMMQPLNAAHGVIFLWTHWNLFNPRYRQVANDPASENPHWPALFKNAEGKSKRVVRMRLFGWAEKISGCQFPQFDPSVHVIPADKVPREGTDYMSADPATARSYFMLWVRVDALGRKFVFDESPSVEEGEWVNSEGERGEGQDLFAGRGSEFYKGYIRRKEREHDGGEFYARPHPGPLPRGEGTRKEPLRRFGDPRAFATEAAAREGGQSLFELYLNEGPDAESAPMYFEPAKVRATIMLDLEKVNDELAYDEKKDISRENEPSLYISERCQNLIRAMLNWGPDQGADSPWKDPIDTLRYLFGEPLHYVDPKVPDMIGGRGW